MSCAFQRPLRNAWLFVLAIALLTGTAAGAAQDEHPQVTMQTSMGDIVLELDHEHAPITVDNFLRYVAEGHFDDTVFYRVVPGFVVQAGSVGADGYGRPIHEPIPLETSSGLKSKRGTVTMAHGDPNSGTADFFINLADNASLDARPDDQDNKTGYTAFGRVVSGMDVVDRIAGVPLGGAGPFAASAPATPIVIRKIVVSATAAAP
jgi:cyclophilin family peptidyl-prolyl cis-trans isomerase